MDWLKFGIEIAVGAIGAAFGSGVAWGLMRGSLQSLTQTVKALSDRNEDMQRNLVAAHRRLDDVDRKVIRVEAQLEFMAKRHDEVIKDLRDALLRIETRLEEALGRRGRDS